MVAGDSTEGLRYSHMMQRKSLDTLLVQSFRLNVGDVNYAGQCASSLRKAISTNGFLII